MSRDNFLNPDLFFKYLWVGLALYILIVSIATIALFYNWSKYSGSKGMWFKVGQTTFLFGMIFLVILATVFYLKI
jgi:hypothetical protein